MAGRPLKTNLSYWHINVALEDDRKIKQLRSIHPDKGFEILFFLWNRMFKESGYGYFIEWNDIQEDLLYPEFYTTKEKMKLVIETCLSVKLFDKALYDRHGILTSKGIQERYLFQMKHVRRIYFIYDYAMIPMDFNEKHDVDIRSKVFYYHFPDIDKIKDDTGFLISRWKELSNRTSLVWPTEDTAAEPKPKTTTSSPPPPSTFEKDSSGKIKPLPFGTAYNFEHEKAIIFSDNEWLDRMCCANKIMTYGNGKSEPDFKSLNEALDIFFEHVQNQNKKQSAMEMQGWFMNWIRSKGGIKGVKNEKSPSNSNLPGSKSDYDTMITWK